MSNLFAPRPYSSSFISSSFPSSSRSMVTTNGNNNISHPSFPLAPPSSMWDPTRNDSSESTWVSSSPSLSASLSRITPSPSLSRNKSPLNSSLAISSPSINEPKRRKIDKSAQSVSSSSSNTLSLSSLSWDNDIASSALALHTLALDYHSFSVPTSSDSPSPPMSLSSSGTSSSSSPLSLSSSFTRSESPSSESSNNEESSPSPPSSPIVIRQKGKQLKSRCTCCHVCRTSLKNYPRNHLDCSNCNSVVCQPCIEFRLSGPKWEEALKESKWLCPSCLGTCVCPRCNIRPIEFNSKSLPSNNKKENNKSKKNPKSSEGTEIEKQVEELKENYLERERFIQEIQNLLCMMKKEQRSIEIQLSSLQNLSD